jgi:hypothetical protein
MPTYPPPDDVRLERLRDLSERITDALADMLAFQAQIESVLRQIAHARGLPMPRPRGPSAGRGLRRGRRRAA